MITEIDWRKPSSSKWLRFWKARLGPLKISMIYTNQQKYMTLELGDFGQTSLLPSLKGRVTDARILCLATNRVERILEKLSANVEEVLPYIGIA